VLNANFDLPTQLNQIQSVATGGQYNAAIVLPVAGQEECTALTKTLPAAKVLVSVLVEPICGRDNKNGVGQWSPGIAEHRRR
jgi:hypothetical protein